ncbi:MAG: hypothetical protein KIT68_11795 [Phycisphaeraceae bacterium]|nr:hypothetical protein [Phycisphaeraceae bacterium]
MSQPPAWPRLRSLGLVPRLGVACLMVVIIGGVAASMRHLWNHYQNRDETPGLTLDDIRSAYRGLTTTSSLLASLQSGHPETLKPESRAALVAWITGPRLAEDYDNLDLGEKAPAEIIAANCVSCHSRKADAQKAGAARAIPLDYWDDIRPRAVSRKINPVDPKILVASTHAHALSMATVGLVVCGLLLMTAWPRPLIGLLIGLVGVGLLGDIGSWWLAAYGEAFVYVIVGAGAAYNGSLVLGAVLVFVDVLLPRR